MLKKSVTKIARTVPKTRKYLDEKEEMRILIIKQQAIIDDLNAQNKKTTDELRLIRGQIPQSVQVQWPVFEEDIITAFSPKTNQKTINLHDPPYIINWVLPPMDTISGGHTDIFRVIAYLESCGHTCRVYFYDALQKYNLSKLRNTIEEHYPSIKSELFYNEKNMSDCDAIFATNWYTAFPVFNYLGTAKKYYFVQDFEPYFEPTGSYSTLAESTYRFGFHGITLNKWLSEKLSKEYGMECDSFDLAVDNKEYTLINKGQRKDIFFYARPVTARRGFEMGVLALKQFHERHPECKIHMLGWDLSMFKLPFPHVDHGILPHKKLNEIYNKCSAGLVISFTNMSLLPLEMLAAGCTPVINDGKNTRLVKYSKYVEYADANPVALANTLSEMVERADLPDVAIENTKAAIDNLWDKSNAEIEKILIRDLGNESAKRRRVSDEPNKK